MRAKLLTHPFSSPSALFWEWSSPLPLHNLSSAYCFSTSHPRLWAQKLGISVSPSPPLVQDLPHPFSLMQPIAGTAIWSQLCAPCQKLLPEMRRKKKIIMMFDKCNLFKTLRSLTEIFPPSLPASFWKPLSPLFLDCVVGHKQGNVMLPLPPREGIRAWPPRCTLLCPFSWATMPLSPTLLPLGVLKPPTNNLRAP